MNRTALVSYYGELEARYNLPEGLAYRVHENFGNQSTGEMWLMARAWDRALNFGRLEAENGLSRGLLMAVMLQESQGAAGIDSGGGDLGLFQFRRSTARDIDSRGRQRVRDVLDPAQSAAGAARYLHDIARDLDARNRSRDSHDRSRREGGRTYLSFDILDAEGRITEQGVPLVIAAYNQGQGFMRARIREHGDNWDVGLVNATYVESVQGYHRQAIRITGTTSITPPEEEPDAPQLGASRTNRERRETVVEWADRHWDNWRARLFTRQPAAVTNATSQADAEALAAIERVNALQTQFGHEGSAGINHAIRHDLAVVAEIQERLAAAGLYTGRVDGLYGRDTFNAWAEYERMNNGRNGVVADANHHISADEVAAILSAPPAPTPRDRPLWAGLNFPSISVLR